MTDNAGIERQVLQWLEQVVIGLRLCPFAQKPLRSGQLKIVVSTATDQQALLANIAAEINSLNLQCNKPLTETTLVVIPQLGDDFYAFNDFMALANQRLEREGWCGEYQLASFHPNYQFAGTRAGDRENLTNAAPYPIVHILREQSISDAVDSYSDIDAIPQRNIQTMQNLSPSELAVLFPYLNPDRH